LNLQVPVGSLFSESGSSSPESPWSANCDHSTTNPIPTHPGATHSLDAQAHIEETRKLCEVNQQIKATLTEMLNTDSVRSDAHFRAWVQERLMDVEQQIRKERRRHSSTDRDAAASAASIAMHISPPEEKRLSWH